MHLTHGSGSSLSRQSMQYYTLTFPVHKKEGRSPSKQSFGDLSAVCSSFLLCSSIPFKGWKQCSKSLVSKVLFPSTPGIQCAFKPDWVNPHLFKVIIVFCVRETPSFFFFPLSTGGEHGQSLSVQLELRLSSCQLASSTCL